MLLCLFLKHLVKHIFIVFISIIIHVFLFYSFKHKENFHIDEKDSPENNEQWLKF